MEDSTLTEYFETFPKPEFNPESSCIICLENIDIESGKKYIGLPCSCSNSIYHIECLLQWIKSGSNKNYCVHCKKVFEIPLQNVITNDTTVNLTNRPDRNSGQTQNNRSRRVGVGITRRIGINRNRRIHSETTRPNYQTTNTQIIMINNSIEDTINSIEILEIENSTLNSTTDSNPDPHPNPNPNSNQNPNTNTSLRIAEIKRQIRLNSSVTKLIVHYILNSVINLINFAYILNIKKADTSLKILAVFFLIKILGNCWMWSDDKDLESISMKQLLSTIVQFILILTTVVIIDNKKYNYIDNKLNVLIYTQVFFFGTNLIISAFINYVDSVRMQGIIFDLGIENTSESINTVEQVNNIEQVNTDEQVNINEQINTSNQVNTSTIIT